MIPGKVIAGKVLVEPIKESLKTSKGIHKIESKETKQKMREAHLGFRHTEESKEKMKGKNHGAWKGEDAGYRAKHYWIERTFGNV